MQPQPRSHSVQVIAALLIALFVYVAVYVKLYRPTPVPDTAYFHDTYFIRGTSGPAAVIFWPLRKLDQYYFPERWPGIHRRIYSPASAPTP